MTATVQQLLASFDALADTDEHQGILEIFRRYALAVEGDLAASVLIEAADELFRTLDAEEAGHAAR